MRASSLTTLLMVGQAACGKVAGFEEFTYSDGGSSESASGAAGAYPIGAGESASCDGGADEASVVDAAAATACGFTCPTRRSAGLPNPAHYTLNASDGAVLRRGDGAHLGRPSRPRLVHQGQAVSHCERKGGSWRLPDPGRVGFAGGFHHPEPRVQQSTRYCEKSPPERFWTSSNAVGDPSIGWYVGFDTAVAHASRRGHRQR